MIKLGNNDISLKLGNDTVDAVYLGNSLVYSGGTPPTPPVPPDPPSPPDPDPSGYRGRTKMWIFLRSPQLRH